MILIHLRLAILYAAHPFRKRVGRSSLGRILPLVCLDADSFVKSLTLHSSTIIVRVGRWIWVFQLIELWSALGTEDSWTQIWRRCHVPTPKSQVHPSVNLCQSNSQGCGLMRMTSNISTPELHFQTPSSFIYVPYHSRATPTLNLLSVADPMASPVKHHCRDVTIVLIYNNIIMLNVCTCGHHPLMQTYFPSIIGHPSSFARLNFQCIFFILTLGTSLST